MECPATDLVLTDFWEGAVIGEGMVSNCRSRQLASCRVLNPTYIGAWARRASGTLRHRITAGRLAGTLLRCVRLF
jgi:hypothetical protein